MWAFALGDARHSTPSFSAGIWPLAVGNQWTWHETNYDTSGAVTDTAVWLIEIVKDSLVNGEHWFIMTGNGERFSEYVLARADGLYLADSLGNIDLKFKYPAQVNDSFATHWGDRIAVVEAIDDLVTVPAGTFVRYRYKTTDTVNFMADFEYLSPGIGFVRGDGYTWKAGPGTDPYLAFRIQLMSYQLMPTGVTIRVPADLPTIQAGIDAASDGDTVLVADGVYTGEGNRDLDFGGRDIILRSEHGPGLTTIDCQGSADEPHRAFYFHSKESPEAKVDGFTIRNGYLPTGGAGGAIRCDSSSPTIANNIITQNYAKDAGGGIFCLNSAPVIAGNVFINNSSDAGGAINLSRSDAMISGNVIARNSVLWEGGGLSLFFSNPILVSNTVVSNTANGGGAFFLFESSPLLDNCIVAFNSGWALHCSGSGPDADHPVLQRCDLFGNGNDWGWCTAGQESINDNMSADPMFCDTAAADYRIQSASMCAPQNNSFGQLVGALPVGCCPIVMAGDVNLDLVCTMADIIYVVNYAFKSGPSPMPCTASADVDCSGRIVASDIIYLVNYVLRAGPPPCEPCTSPMPCTLAE